MVKEKKSKKHHSHYNLLTIETLKGECDRRQITYRKTPFNDKDTYKKALIHILRTNDKEKDNG